MALFEMFRTLWFVTPGQAEEPTSTDTVMTLELPGSTGLRFVQVAVYSAAEQLHPLPAAET